MASQDGESENERIIMDEDDGVKRTENTSNEVGPQPINKSQFRNEVLDLIERAVLSGLDEDDVQDELQDLAEGAPYFAESLRRIANRQTQNEGSR